MTQDTTPITVPLSPVEAELIRYAELEYRRVTEEAKAKKQESVALVLEAKQVPPGAQWSIGPTPDGGLAVSFVPPAPVVAPGQIERKLELVPGGASEGNGAASEAGGAKAP